MNPSRHPSTAGRRLRKNLSIRRRRQLRKLPRRQLSRRLRAVGFGDMASIVDDLPRIVMGRRVSTARGPPNVVRISPGEDAANLAAGQRFGHE